MQLQKSILPIISIGTILCLGWLACEKTTFNTTPSLTFVRADNYDLKQGDLLTFRLKLTDKEGDLQDTLFLRAATTRCPNNSLTIGYPMPAFPQKPNIDAEIVVRYIINQFTDGVPIWSINLCPGPDTVNFQFWVKDEAKNISDTVQTDQPIIIANN